jgi:hypothetical protein
MAIIAITKVSTTAPPIRRALMVLLLSHAALLPTAIVRIDDLGSQSVSGLTNLVIQGVLSSGHACLPHVSLDVP